MHSHLTLAMGRRENNCSLEKKCTQTGIFICSCNLWHTFFIWELSFLDTNISTSDKTGLKFLYETVQLLHAGFLESFDIVSLTLSAFSW